MNVNTPNCGPATPPRQHHEAGTAAGAGPQPDRLSLLGQRFTRHSAILELMDNLGRALTSRPEILMLGGGNPAVVPAMQAIWRARMQDLLADGDAYDRMLANYEPPQGNPRFLEAFARLMERSYGWPVTAENVAVTAGTQTACFFLFNLLAGRHASGQRKILLPMSPEYIGYADQGLEPDLFVSCRSAIVWPEGEEARVFKYRIDFQAVERALRAGGIAAAAVSRPTNPTGNAITQAELERLTELTAEHGVLLIVDNAYGAPFPGVLFTEAAPHFAPHVINTFSLSKLGLPGVRTGIVVAPREIAAAIKSWTAIAGLANSNLGQHLLLPWVENGGILRLGPEILRPFYAQKSRAALGAVREFLGATSTDWAVHASEGAFFLWLWLRGLRVSTTELYRRLKERGVVVVPGESFFYGQRSPSPQEHECLRLSFAQPEEIVREGIRRLAEAMRGV